MIVRKICVKYFLLDLLIVNSTTPTKKEQNNEEKFLKKKKNNNNNNNEENEQPDDISSSQHPFILAFLLVHMGQGAGRNQKITLLPTHLSKIEGFNTNV